MEPNMADWRILVVEDEIDGGEVMADILAHYGVAADVVTTGEAAVDLLAANRYTAAIIDLALPGMDGLTLVHTIRSMDGYAHLPCVAHTAYHNARVRQDALSKGFDAYLDKPIGQAVLMQTLKEVISLARKP